MSVPAVKRSEAVQWAFRLFLLGGPDGKRVTQWRKLSEITGVGESHLCKVAREDDWKGKAEARELAIANQTSPAQLAMVPELAQLAAVREKGELAEVKMGELEVALEAAVVGTEAYDTLLSQWERTRKIWERYSGIGAALDAEEARQKALATTAGKARGKQEAGSQGFQPLRQVNSPPAQD